MKTKQPTLNEALKEWALARRAYLQWMNGGAGEYPSSIDPAKRNRYDATDMRISDRYNAADEQLARMIAGMRRKSPQVQLRWWRRNGPLS